MSEPHPCLQGALRRVVEACRARGVAAGNFAVTEAKAQARRWTGLVCVLGRSKQAARVRACRAARSRANARRLPPCLTPVQELLGMGFTCLATGTDLGLLGEAAAKNASFASGLRGKG